MEGRRKSTENGKTAEKKSREEGRKRFAKERKQYEEVSEI